MLGDSILIAPKITRPVQVASNDKKFLMRNQSDRLGFPINFYLPNGFEWYFYYTHLREPNTGFIKDRVLNDEQQGIFIKGGHILPIKLHNGSLSLLRTVLSPIRLDIYLDKDN